MLFSNNIVYLNIDFWTENILGNYKKYSLVVENLLTTTMQQIVVSCVIRTGGHSNDTTKSKNKL